MAFDVTALLALPRVGELAVAPDGTWAAVVVARLDADGTRFVSDLWKLPLDGRPARRLTAGPGNDTRPRFTSDGRLAFLSDRDPTSGGAAAADARRAQVWVFGEGALGEPTVVTDEPLGVADFVFTERRLFVLAEVMRGLPRAEQRARATDLARGPSALRYTDDHVRHWDEWLPRTGLHLLVMGTDGAGAVDLTPDAQHELRNLPGDPVLDAALDRAVVGVGAPGDDRNDDTWLRVFDVGEGGAVAVRDLGRAARVNHGTAKLSPGGRRIIAERAQRQPPRSEHVRLHLYDVDGGTDRPVAPRWDARAVVQAWSGPASVLVVADDDGDVPVFEVQLGVGTAADDVRRRTQVGVWDHVRPLPGGDAVGVHHRLTAPPNPARVAAGADALAALTPTPPELAGLIVERRTTDVDGASVSWFVVRPPGDAPAPVLYWIHGGPESQFADGWHWRWSTALAAAAGYAVVLPNPRGSTGRGQLFLDAIRGNTWGGQCYADLMAVCDDLARDPHLDASRMAAMGGSFGGYMVNWIGTQTDRFRAIVSHAGIFHLAAFHGTTDYPAYFAMEMGGSPYVDGADYARYSPHAFVSRWKTPALIIHGERDYRVPISDALILYAALREHGVDTELLVFPDEGHWITKPRNIRAWYDVWMEFVAARLGDRA